MYCFDFRFKNNKRNLKQFKIGNSETEASEMNTEDLFSNNHSVTTNSSLLQVEEEIGGIRYISKNLGMYIPYVSLFGLGLITGVVGKLNRNETKCKPLINADFHGYSGNTLIIGTILFVKDLRQNPTFMLIVNLSLSDIVVSVVVDTSTIVGK